MMEDALEELRQLTRSKAAWFRLIEGGHLVATHAVGVSQDFLREAGFAELTESVSQMLERGKPVTAHRSGAARKMRDLLKAEKLQYVVMVPVLGKKSPIGLLILGSARDEKADRRGTGVSGDLRTAVGNRDREFPSAGAGAALAAAVAEHV